MNTPRSNKRTLSTPAQNIEDFYASFQSVRDALLDRITGCSTLQERERCTSFLLHSLTLLYFLQQKGYFGGDTAYLSNHLRSLQEQEGGNTFLSFHLHLLQTLFPDEDSATDSMTFVARKLMQSCPTLGVPDDIFALIFAFFERWHWQLDEQTIQNEQALRPTILCTLFEQYLNRQQMGTYYTQDDVTLYIATNTIIPCLFDTVQDVYPAAFAENGRVWQLLHEHFEQYTSTRAGNGKHSEDVLKIHTSDAMVTLNLDMRSFARDVILACEEPELLWAWYRGLEQMTVLDPTCGSGAFLFAALEVLEPLYIACLERMQTLGSVEFWPLLQQVERYHNRSYFARHAVLQHNLYGVDIMEEAVEVCMLRLYLKLLALVEGTEDIKELPRLDQHIRVGNALVGYVSEPSAEPGREDDECRHVDACNHLLAQEYGIAPTQGDAFESWLRSHAPLHWCYAFQEIMNRGGFSVIIGNPPYVEYSAHLFPYTLRDFETLACSNLYPCVVERSHQLLAAGGRHGMILPLAAFATRNMLPLIEGFQRWFSCTWLSFYHFRPSMLFHGSKTASIPTAIYLAKARGEVQRYSTSIAKWKREERAALFPQLSYCRITAPEDPENRHYYPKFGMPLENAIMRKVLCQRRIGDYRTRIPSQNSMYYRTAGGLYWKVFLNFAWPYQTTSNKRCFFQEGYERDVFVALLNSSLFWWYYTVTFDTFNLKDYMLFGFRFTYPTDSAVVSRLKDLCGLLMDDFRRHARHLKRGATGSYTVYAKQSKPIIDEIDRVLAQHYGFTEEELAFILHYDSKFRLGLDAAEEV